MLNDPVRPKAIWDTVLTATRLHCDEDVFTDLISRAHLEQYDPRSESVVIQIPQGVSKSQFQRDALEPLVKAFANAIGVSPTIYIEESSAQGERLLPRGKTTTHAAQALPQGPSETEAPSHHTARLSDVRFQLNPAYSFESFVIGPSNRLAEAAGRAVAENPGKAYNPLFIHGSVGLGKTHLLQAICHKILENRPQVRVQYLSCEQFVNGYIEALKSGRQTAFRKAFRGIDLLVIDDIHFLASKEATQEEFFHTFNELYNAGKQIIISSDSPPKDIPEMEERLTSRFLWGLPVRIDPPCLETRQMIVSRKAEQRRVQMPSDVAFFIAETVTSNIRELEGAVIQVAAMANMLERPISIAIAREALKDLVTFNASKRVSVDDIVEATCRHFGVRPADLQSHRRTRSVTIPRQVAMYLAKKLTQKTLNEIGGYFGGRDHTTVLHSIRKVDIDIGSQAGLAERIRVLENELAKDV